MNNKANCETFEKWVNLEDVASYLSVSKDTIRAWIKSNKFKLSEIESCVRSGAIEE